MLLIFAIKDIKQGDELIIDYCDGEQDLNKRNEILAKYGIIEKWNIGRSNKFNWKNNLIEVNKIIIDIINA